MTIYTCKECGAPVERKGDEFKRDCEHKDVGIIASLKATATGKGAMQ